MYQLFIALYILVGILTSPSCYVMEELFYPNAWNSSNKKMVLLRSVSYYLFWPIAVSFYFWQIIKRRH